MPTQPHPARDSAAPLARRELEPGDRQRLRHEAREHSAQARRLRELSRRARRFHDPIGALKFECAANERTRLAKQARTEAAS